jgi:hypothetical protein
MSSATLPDLSSTAGGPMSFFDKITGKGRSP